MGFAYIGLGSNLGKRFKNLEKGIKILESLDWLKVMKKSSVYLTEPVGYEDQSWFLNMVIKAETNLLPSELLDKLLEIEKKMGREKSGKNGPRKIDLDLLFYDDQIINTKKLTLPHPQLHKRRFVLVPLLEVSRNKIHPLKKKRIFTLLKELKDEKKIKLFKRENHE